MKYWHFAKTGSAHKFHWHFESKSTYFAPFFWEKAMKCINNFRPIFCIFWTRRIFYRPQNGQNPQIKNPKNRFFQNCLKCDLFGLKWWFVVQNDSKTPKGPISGHISPFRPISAILQEFNFLAKIDFWAILWIFDFSQYALPFGRKWSKIRFMARNSLFGSPKHFYIPYMIFHDD